MLIDVIIPIYGSADLTRRCIKSVLAGRHAMRQAFELVLLDDASPGNEIAALLLELAGESGITILRNSTNLGFVATVNRGMALHPDRDVVLLNSDTEVANDWLDRLHAHAVNAADIGTVTPFSNNATICSYPFEGWPGGVPGHLGLAKIDALCAETNCGQSVALPTAVGFCMYICRTCLNQVGMFDVERFGRGYGEENDFCLRASKMGWRHLLAADVFVFHEGGASFSAERCKLQETAMRALLAAHPDYLERIAGFMSADPIAPMRAKLDIARIAQGGPERREVIAEQLGCDDPSGCLKRTRLHILHGWGGGTSRWVADFCKADTECRNLVLRSSSDRNHTARWLELLEIGVGETVLMRWELSTPIDGTAIEHPQYLAILELVCETFGVGAVMVSSLIGHALSVLDTTLPTTIVLHDLYPFCPALFGYFQETCTGCSSDRLATCLHENPHNVFWHNTQADQWSRLRSAFLIRLMGGRKFKFVAPSASVWQRWTQLLPEMTHLDFTKIAHGTDAEIFHRPQIGAMDDRHRLRVVVPGRLPPHKGLLLVREVVARLADHCDFLLLGSGAFGAALESFECVEIIPDYAPSELVGHIARFQPDLALLASVLPESFGYTLSEMNALGIPVLATRLGAFAERIEAGVTGFLADPSSDALENTLRMLVTDRACLRKVRERVERRPVRTLQDMVDDYRRATPNVRGQLRRGADYALTRAAFERMRQVKEIDRMKTEAELMRSQLSLAAEREARCMELTGQLEACKKEMVALRSSTSWKVTTPLRAVKSLWLERHQNTVGKDSARMSLPRQSQESLPELALPAMPMNGRVDTELRRLLDLPDAATVVLIAGNTDPESFGALLQTMETSTAKHNNVFFIMPFAGIAIDSATDHRARFHLLLATRRLFIDNYGMDTLLLSRSANIMIVCAGTELVDDQPDSSKIIVWQSHRTTAERLVALELALTNEN